MSGIFHHLMAYVFDPFWKYVTLLLHGNGTNGAQNNTFIDSSTNAFTVTRNGTPTQGSVSPFGPDWSNYFNGTSDYLTFSNNAAFQFGTGDFTVEFWFNANSLSGTPAFFAKWDATLGRSYVLQATATSLIWATGAGTTPSGDNTLTASSLTIALNVWNHVAITRTGTTQYIFLNGIQVGTNSSSVNMTGTAPLTISVYGRPTSTLNYFPGYISNFRIVKGAAVYTAAFTPSTSPLTAITNTSLLTCQSNYFKDNSTNNFAITATGTPSVQRFSPFNMGSAYSTSVIGGSGYYNGSTDYLTAANNAAFAFGSGDFTVEFWMYSAQTNASSTNPALLVGHVTSGGATNTNWGIYLGFPTLAGNIAFYASDGTTFQVALGSSVTLVNNSAWNHIAVTRSGSSFYMFINGTQAATATWAGTISSTSRPLAIGFNTTSQYYNGYISNLRLVKGTALYTAAFTPPTAPLTAITNTSLLLSTINGGIYDNAMQNNLLTAGAAQVSTTQSKFGGASISFSAGTSYLLNYNKASAAFGSGGFTIEFWLYVNSLPTNPADSHLFDSRPASTNGAYTLIYLNSSGAIKLWVNSADRITSSVISTGTWYHVAVSRSSGSTKMFLNGTQTGSTYTDATVYLAGDALIGASYSGGASITNFLNGYIDDLRVTKYGRYTANFTPPTSQLLDY